MEFKTLKDRLVLTPEQLRYLIKDEKMQTTPGKMLELMDSIIYKCSTENNNNNSRLLDKLLYLLFQVYIIGYSKGLNDSNAATERMLEMIREEGLK